MHLVCPEILVLRERWEQEEIKDSVGLLVKMVCVVHPGYKARRAGQGILVLWVHKEKRETWEMLERWDHLEFKGLQAWLDNLVSKEFRVCLEILDHLEDRVIQVPQELMERTVLMVKLETPVHQETEESLEKMEVQVFKV